VNGTGKDNEHNNKFKTTKTRCRQGNIHQEQQTEEALVLVLLLPLVFVMQDKD
jgi:hypothetical protein